MANIEQPMQFAYDKNYIDSIPMNSIIAEIKSKFPAVSTDENASNNKLPLNKFIPYADSIISSYKNSENNVFQLYIEKLSTLSHGIDINMELVYKVVNSLFNIEKNSESYIQLLKLLRDNRYIIYISQYIDLINNSSTNPEYPNAIITNNNIYTGKREYFNIYNIFTIDCLLYELYILDNSINVFPDNGLFLLVAGNELANTKTISNVKSTIEAYFTYLQENEHNYSNINIQFYGIHGAPNDKLGVVPPNKIILLRNPFNRLGFANNHLLNAFAFMLSPDNIANFIASPTCFIDKFINNENKNNPKAEPIINGFQIFYGGQTFFDMALSLNKKQIHTTFGKFILTGGKFDRIPIFPEGIDSINTTLSQFLQSLDPTTPEIIIFSTCRNANTKLHNSIIELTYRYNKIHNIITDNLGICYKPVGDIPQFSHSPFNLNNNYTKLYGKKFSVSMPNTSKLPNNERELHESLFRNTNLSPIRNKELLITGKAMEHALFKNANNEIVVNFIIQLVSKDIKSIVEFLYRNPTNLSEKLHIIISKMAELRTDMHNSYGYAFLMLFNELTHNERNLFKIALNLNIYMSNYQAYITSNIHGLNISPLIKIILDKLLNLVFLYDPKNPNNPFLIEDYLNPKYVEQHNNITNILNYIVLLFTDKIDINSIKNLPSYITYVINPKTGDNFSLNDIYDVDNLDLFIGALNSWSFAIDNRDYLDILVSNYCYIYTSNIRNFDDLTPEQQTYMEYIDDLYVGNTHPLVRICYNLFNNLHNSADLNGFADLTEKYTYMLTLIVYIINIFHASTCVFDTSSIVIYIDKKEHPVYTIIMCLSKIMGKVPGIVINSSILYNFISIYYFKSLVAECVSKFGNVFDALVSAYFSVNTNTVHTQTLISNLPSYINTIDTSLGIASTVDAFKTFLCIKNSSSNTMFNRKLFIFIRDTNIIDKSRGFNADVGINKSLNNFPIPNNLQPQPQLTRRRNTIRNSYARLGGGSARRNTRKASKVKSSQVK